MTRSVLDPPRPPLAGAASVWNNVSGPPVHRYTGNGRGLKTSSYRTPLEPNPHYTVSSSGELHFAEIVRFP